MNFRYFDRLSSTLAPHRLLAAALALALGSWLTAVPAFAQRSTALTAVYGRGVHAYFAGDSALAEQYFTQVIEAGSSDPRPYYFRAMLRLGTGRKFEAENDMRVGAAYEARDPGDQHSMGRSLQRIQGPGRRTLEQFRRQARLDRLQQGRRRTQQRYEQLDRRGPAVLRRPTALPLEQPIQPPQQLAVPGAPIDAGSGTRPVVPPALQLPAVTEAPAAAPVLEQPASAGSGTDEDPDDLFGSPAPVTPEGDPLDTPPPAATPAPSADQEDPFSELPSPAPAEDDDPFGDTPAPAEDTPMPEVTEEDPFADEPAAEESAAEEPVADEPEPATEAEEADPFAESADDEAEEMPADDPADDAPSEEDDPFGESAEPAGDDDPFDESTETADEDDPFGESTESDEATEEDDPFGESAEQDSGSADDSAPADDEPEPAADEDDPFGESTEDDSAPAEDAEDDPFDIGAVPPSIPAGELAAESVVATAPDAAAASPAGQMFFALGQWIASRGRQPAVPGPQFGESDVIQADFELGPAEDVSVTTAGAELDAEDDPFAENDPLGEDDPFAESAFRDATPDAAQQAADTPEEDPSEIDPFEL